MAKNTNKELHKLHRQDLLELLIGQSREVAQQQETITENEKTIAELNATLERLKDKLNEKDALIEKLKGRLDEKDEAIRILREGGLITNDENEGATVRLEELFLVLHMAGEAYMRKKTQRLKKEDAARMDDE
ncbi:MAG: hypothetical protein II713_00610 [Clostridia bacterium]|nr:hypothetical protein [Clostridia bacterium]